MAVKLEWHKPGYLKRLRRKAGLTQGGLGKACGFSPKNISDFEKGQLRIGPADAIKLYLGVAGKAPSHAAILAAREAAIEQKVAIAGLVDELRQDSQQAAAELKAAEAWLAQAEAWLGEADAALVRVETNLKVKAKAEQHKLMPKGRP